MRECKYIWTILGLLTNEWIVYIIVFHMCKSFSSFSCRSGFIKFFASDPIHQIYHFRTPPLCWSNKLSNMTQIFWLQWFSLFTGTKSIWCWS